MGIVETCFETNISYGLTHIYCFADDKVVFTFVVSYTIVITFSSIKNPLNKSSSKIVVDAS